MRINSLSILVILSLLPCLQSCGGSGGSSGTSTAMNIDDGLAPNVSISFPFTGLATNNTSVNVHGTAADNSGVRSLNVNGVAAQTTDDFDTWSVLVPLNPGENTLVVATEDLTGNRDTQAAVIEIISTVFLSGVQPTHPLVIDEGNNQVVLLRQSLRSLHVVDLNTGVSRELSNSDYFQAISAVAIDQQNNRALVIDNTDGELLAVDLLNGETSVLSNGGGGGFANRIAIDEVSNRAFLSYSEANKIVAVDLETGQWTDFYTSIVSPRHMHVDATNNRLLVANHIAGPVTNSKIYAIDLDTSVSIVLYESHIDHFTIDRGGNRLIANSNAGYIYIDLTTGQSAPADFPHGYDTEAIAGFSFDNGSQRLLLGVEGRRSNLYSYSFVTRDMRQLNPYANSTDLNVASNLQLGIRSNELVVVDADGIKTIDLDASSISLLAEQPSSVSSYWSGPCVLGGAVDRGSDRLLVTDHCNRSIYEIDFTTGAAITLSSPTLPNNTNNLDLPYALALDAARDRALVIDYSLGQILAVDLNTGVRSIITTLSEPYAAATIAIDEASNRAFFTKSRERKIVVIDLMTDQLSTFVELDERVGPPRGLSIDTGNNRLLMTHQGIGFRDDILAFDLATASQSSISLLGQGVKLRSPRNVVYEDTKGYLYVVDSEYPSLIIADPYSGEKMMIIH